MAAPASPKERVMWSLSNRARVARALKALSEAGSIAAFLKLLAPVAATISGAIVAFALGHGSIAAFLAGGLCALIVATLGVFFPLRAVFRRLVYGYRLVEVRITLLIDAFGSNQHERIVELVPHIIRTGTRLIQDRYCEAEPRSDDRKAPQHKPTLVGGEGVVLGPTWDGASRLWRYYVELGAPQVAGDETRLTLRQLLDFRRRPHLPTLQRTIVEPTDSLTLKLVLPASHWPVVACGEAVVPGDLRRRMEVELDAAHHEIQLHVPNPRFGTSYLIRWTSVSPHSAPEPSVALPAAIH